MCTGIGTELEVDPELIVPDEDLSLAQGAIAPWGSGSGSAEYFQRVLTALAEDLTFSMDVPYVALPQRAKDAVLYGENFKVHVRYQNRYGRDRSYSTGFEGAVPFVRRRHKETESEWSRERYEGYMREVPRPISYPSAQTASPKHQTPHYPQLLMTCVKSISEYISIKTQCYILHANAVICDLRAVIRL